MKFVTVCEQGNNRSAHAAWYLRHKRGGGINDTIPMGIMTTTSATQEMLFEWADYIILMDSRFQELIPDKYMDKLKVWDVGKDRWPRPFHKELIDIIRKYADRDSEMFD